MSDDLIATARKFWLLLKSIAKQLGLRNSIVRGRGVDTNIFNTIGGKRRAKERTIITVGRVGNDKNLDDFSYSARKYAEARSWSSIAEQFVSHSI